MNKKASAAVAPNTAREQRASITRKSKLVANKTKDRKRTVVFPPMEILRVSLTIFSEDMSRCIAWSTVGYSSELLIAAQNALGDSNSRIGTMMMDDLLSQLEGRVSK